jgi:hypothetical protein
MYAVFPINAFKFKLHIIWCTYRGKNFPHFVTAACFLSSLREMESIVAKLVTTEIRITGYTNMRKYGKYEYVEIRKCGYTK